MRSLLTLATCVLATALLSFAAPAVAATPPWAERLKDLCWSFNVHRAYTPEQTASCFQEVLLIEDGRLTEIYDAALARLASPRQKATLERAQKAWIAFRDADCATYGDPDWGGGAASEVARCRIWRTMQRRGELSGYDPAGVAPARTPGPATP